MEIREELSLIAVIGVAVAGFLSIVVVFVNRDGRFSASDSVRVIGVVVSAFGCVFSALVPLVLHQLGFHADVLWRIAGGVALCSAVPVSIYMVARQRLAKTNEKPMSNWTPIGGIAIVIGPVNFAIWVLLAMGFFASIAPGLYLLTLVLGLVIGASNFVVVALARLI